MRRRSSTRIVIIVCLAVGWIAIATTVAGAHPIGNFTLNMSSGIHVEPGRARIDYVLEMAEISTQEQKPGMDLDSDDAISAEERAGWAERAAAQIGTNLTMVANGQPVALTLTDSSLIFRPGQGGLDLLYMEATFEGALPGSGEVYYADANYEDRPGWREISAVAEQGVVLTSASVPDHSLSEQLKAYPADLVSEPLNVREADFSYQASDAPVEPTVPTEGGSTASSSPAGPGGFADLLATSSDRATGLLLALALGFGFLHALGPGHGKTIMAASTLSGSVRLRHAVSLGGVVALMHCASVIAIGLVALAATRSISSENVFSALRMITALGILIVGAVLLVVRWRQRRDAHTAHPNQGKGGHHHGHAHPLPPERSAGVDRAGIAAVAASGGLLPSPSAVVVLLGAIAVDRIPLGIALVIAFSIGLAASLVLVGAISHVAKTWVGRAESSLTAWIPLASAAAIFVVGVLLTVEAVRSNSFLSG